MNLQPLFREPIIQQSYLDPGYSGHANDVWRVKTATEEVVMRMYRWPGEMDGPFWWGCHQLFGIDPRQLFALEPLNTLLNSLGSLAVPRVLRKGVIDAREYVVVEYMHGTDVEDLRAESQSMLEDFGRALAQFHCHVYQFYGHPLGHLRQPLASFHSHLVDIMQKVVQRFYMEDRQLQEALDPMCTLAMQLPSPKEATFVMIDLDASQFLSDGQRVTAVVDTEGYVVGPRELDFIALEYMLDQRAAAAFTRGYQRVLPLPDLATVRPVYRYFYRLLEVQGSPDLTDWLNQQVLFA